MNQHMNEKELLAWLKAEVYDFAIHRETVNDILTELGAKFDYEDVANWLEFFGHPELAEKLIEENS
jgi:hypothetical protein